MEDEKLVASGRFVVQAKFCATGVSLPVIVLPFFPSKIVTEKLTERLYCEGFRLEYEVKVPVHRCKRLENSKERCMDDACRAVMECARGFPWHKNKCSREDTRAAILFTSPLHATVAALFVLRTCYARPLAMFSMSSLSPPISAELSPYELHRKPHEMVTDSTVVAVSPRALRSELMCPICLDLMKTPQTTKEVGSSAVVFIFTFFLLLCICYKNLQKSYYKQ